ncbi:transmembrane protein 135-like [Cimex lectularius]|uniref:Transmembrane protein 135 N-terminal domain-containing protein n=1 Tax=Cimex lectularius TaxID=79782 RepID=A0A8I6RY67_CIMLE|nr:transmembrane protein 135-like [Cimex lectularius]
MVLSKFQTIDTTCVEYVHPWNESCYQSALTLVRPCVKESLRIYVTAYLISLLLRRKVPTKVELYKALLGIIQSSIFLTSHGLGFSASVCLVRRIMGNFNFLTVSFIPSFLSSIVSILIERPSRRGLLSLYVTNVASETVFRMAVDRRLFRPIPFGEVFIFSASVATLLYFYKGIGLPKDPIYSLLKMLVGPCEEVSFKKPEEEVPVYSLKSEKGSCSLVNVQAKLVNAWRKFVFYLKSQSSHPSCPHQFSCAYYTLSAGSRLFIIGYLIQLSFKYLLNLRKIKKNPNLLLKIPLKLENMGLATCFAGFSSIFRAVMCTMRRLYDQDYIIHSLPAGFLAGLSFYFYRDNTIALYFMWKMVQICYNLGSDKGHFPKLNWAPIFFHAFSTAILFHVAILEPHNLRPSYWNFLQAMSGGKIAIMDRVCMDRFGLESSRHLSEVLGRKGKEHR